MMEYEAEVPRETGQKVLFYSFTNKGLPIALAHTDGI